MQGMLPMSADALRAYLRTLRDGRDLTQEQVAQAIGLAYRSYVDWELGTTKELKGTFLIRIVQLLRGSWDHAQRLAKPSATIEQARDMALDALASDITSKEDLDALIAEWHQNKQLRKTVRKSRKR